MSGKNIFLKFSQASQPKEASSGRVVGERGRNDLPPGKKGGETMTPDRHYEHKQTNMAQHGKIIVEVILPTHIRAVPFHN